jgi:predicted nucleic acid-binding protein
MATKGGVPRVYLCATEWAPYLEGNPSALQAALDRAKDGDLEIVASELLRVEVLNVHDLVPDPAVELLERAVGLWVPLERSVAMTAKGFRERAMREGKSIKRMTADIIHMASAEVAQVDTFVTNDDDCRRLASFFGLPAVVRSDYPPDPTLMEAYRTT